MPKVIIVGSAYPLRGGGLATFNERLARAFMQAGWETVIYTFSLQYPSFLFPGTSQYSDEAAPEGLDIRVQVNSINPFNWLASGIKIRKEKADLVIYRYWLPFMGPCLGSIARIVKRKGTKQIAITDNVIPHEKRPGDRLFTQYFVNAMDGFVAMSKAVLKDLEEFDTKKPRAFCPHPLYDNFGAPMPREEAIRTLGLDPAFRYLLFFGFIRAYKGLDLLLEALADARFKGNSIRLIIAGEYYQDPAPIKELIGKLGIEPLLIQHNDFIPNEKVRAYFSAADLVVQPYREATQSGVTQIAYHFCVPMVVTNVSGLPENIPDGRVGFVVAPEKQAVAEGILRFFQENRSDEFRANMLEERKKFSWENMLNILTATAGIRP